MAIAENLEYIKAYNEYLKDHNLTQTADVYTEIDGRMYDIQSDLFFGFLVDKIIATVIRDFSFINPLAFLYSDGIYYGARIEDAVPVLKSKVEGYGVDDFVTDVQNPFTKNKSDMSVAYHRITDRKIVTVTVSYEQVKQAFTSTYGVDALVNALIKVADTQLNGWEYHRMREVLENEDWGETIFIKTFEEFSLKLKDLDYELSDYDESAKYNNAAINAPAQSSDIIAIVNGKYKNKADLQYFAGLYNVSFADWKGNIKYISGFNNKNIVAKIFDKRGVFFKRALDTKRILENGKDLTYNHFTHNWRMFSVSPHFNSITIIKIPEEQGISELSLESGIYKGPQQVTLNKNGATTVKYKVGNGGQWITVDGADPVTINIAKSNKVTISFDGYTKTYHYRIV